MISQKALTQKEIDDILKELGLTATGTFTLDKSQQLYTDIKGSGIVLPSCGAADERSAFPIDTIIWQAKNRIHQAELVGKHVFEVKPALKVIEGDKS